MVSRVEVLELRVQSNSLDKADAQNRTSDTHTNALYMFQSTCNPCNTASSVARWVALSFRGGEGLVVAFEFGHVLASSKALGMFLQIHWDI